jgi:MFS family permease
MAQYWQDLRQMSRDARIFLAAAAVVGLGISGFSVIYNLYLLELGLSPGNIGTIIAASVVGLAVAGLPGSYLADRTNPRLIVLAAIAASVMTMSLRATFTSVGGLILAAFLNGANSSLFWVAGLTLMAAITSARDRSMLFSLSGLTAGLISVPGNLLAGSLPQLYRQAMGITLLQAERLTLFSMTLFMLMGLILFSRLRASGAVRPHASSEPTAESTRVAAPADIGTMLLQVGLVAALIGLADGLFFPFGNIFFKQRYGFEPAQVGYVFAANEGLVVVLFLFLPLLTARWKKAHILATFRFIALPLIAVLALGIPAWLAGPSFALALTAFTTTMVTGDNIIVDIVPAAFRARAAGVRYLGVSLGAIVSNAVGGWLIQNQGYQWPIAGSVVLGTLLALSLIVFYGRRETAPNVRAIAVT